MINVDEAVIARLKKDGNVFEVLVDCDKALEFKQGKGDLNDVLATDDIYKDVKKGEKASENEIKDIFNTEDKNKVAEIVIKEGEVQLTAKHQAKEREEKLKKIISIIHRNAIDPKTGLPHPPQRIENVIKEAKVQVNDSKTAEEQVEDVLDKLKPLIPIKFEKRELELKINNKFAGQSFHVLKKFGKVLKEEWLGDGSLKVLLEIPSGIQDEFFSELNGVCHGEVESKVVRTI